MKHKHKTGKGSVFVKRLRDSKFVSLIAVFAAFAIICDSLVSVPLPYSGVWYSWVFVSEPIAGIILGPLTGFFSTLIGVMIGHSINFVDFYEFLFTLGAPVGAMISGLLYRGKFRMVLVSYLVLLGAFFATPVAWQLPVWGMWDTYLAFVILLAAFAVTRKWANLWNTGSSKQRAYVLALSAFIGLEADVLFRIFLLIPCQTYQLFYGGSVGTLQTMWAVGAVETPIKAALSTIITVITGLPIISVVKRLI